jgi:YidC/Oxa1 family membrane protein insertase
MNKNTIIGFLLIGVLLFGFAWLNKPSEEQIREQKRLQAYNDSIAFVNQRLMQEAEMQKDSLIACQIATTVSDSLSLDKFGAFAVSATGEEKFYTLENNLIKLTISNKGGQIVRAELKNYKMSDTITPLYLLDSEHDGSSLEFNLVTNNNRIVSTKDLYFESLQNDSVSTVTEGEQTFSFRLNAGENTYIDYIYTLKANDYMIGFQVKGNGMDKVLAYQSSLQLLWNTKIKQQERSKKFEGRYAQLNYKAAGGDVEKLSETKDDSQTVVKAKWIAFKDQFFSSILIADSILSDVKLNSKIETDATSEYLKDFSADMSVPFDPTGKKATGFKFYFGPNHFKTLNSYNKGVPSDKEWDLEKIVPLGWGIFGWINKFVVIPVFNFFSGFITDFGIIILLLTILVKLVLFPLTYKSYMSMAKMRVLKPQIDEIHAKIPKEKMQERQAATMALYRKVGVSPMGGCLPMLLQMPILFALFSFFPSAIELRQQSFLWASDLSSYDAIITWKAQIPFISEYFGNHISLFCLLMTVTNIIYTHINMKTQADTSQQLPGMKYMMYFMPVMFLFIFNDYASGLSYYYFISTLITIIQTYAIRAFVDEEALLKKLHERAKDPKKQKKSGFLARLEEAQRKQVEMQKKQQKRK